MNTAKPLPFFFAVEPPRRFWPSQGLSLTARPSAKLLNLTAKLRASQPAPAAPLQRIA